MLRILSFQSKLGNRVGLMSFTLIQQQSGADSRYFATISHRTFHIFIAGLRLKLDIFHFMYFWKIVALCSIFLTAVRLWTFLKLFNSITYTFETSLFFVAGLAFHANILMIKTAMFFLQEVSYKFGETICHLLNNLEENDTRKQTDIKHLYFETTFT